MALRVHLFRGLTGGASYASDTFVGRVGVLDALEKVWFRKGGRKTSTGRAAMPESFDSSLSRSCTLPLNRTSFIRGPQPPVGMLSAGTELCDPENPHPEEQSRPD